MIDYTTTANRNGRNATRPMIVRFDLDLPQPERFEGDIDASLAELSAENTRRGQEQRDAYTRLTDDERAMVDYAMQHDDDCECRA